MRIAALRAWGRGIGSGRAAVCAGVLGLAAGAMGQWSNSSTNTLLVGDLPGDNGIPLILPAGDGGCYIGWSAWTSGSAGYEQRLSRLDADGNEVWGQNGIQVAPGAITFTIVGGYDIAVGSDGSVFCVVDTPTDPAWPGVRQCNIQKISPTGVKQWGVGGANIAVSTGEFGGAPAHICAMPDGGCVVGYTRLLPSTTGNDFIVIRRYTPAGTLAWASSRIIQLAGTDLILCDLQPADGDNFIASWLLSRNEAALATQKFTGAGGIHADWPNPVTLDASGLTPRDFPTFKPDGVGGGIYAWRSYANNGFGAPSEAKLQHMLSNGTAKFGAAALPCFDATFAPNQGRQSASVDFTYDGMTGQFTYFVAGEQGPITNGTNRSSVVQKIDDAGNLVWGGGGFTVMPESFNPQIGPTQTKVVATGDGSCMVLGNVVRGTTTVNRVVYGSKVSTDGFGFPAADWLTIINSDATTDKGRLAAVRQTGSSDALMAFGWGGGLGGRIAAAKVASADGAPGVMPVAPTIDVDLPTSVQACDGDTVQLTIQVSGTPNLVFRWMRHYPNDIPGNPEAFWSLSDGDSSFGCVIPDDGTTYAGTNTATLTINNVHALPAMVTNTNCSVTSNPLNNTYRCMVFNAADAVVYSATVFIDVLPCACPGDFDDNGVVEVADIFSFLNAWFAQFGTCASGCSADVDGMGGVQVADIFAFLNQWFGQFGTPCP